MGPLSDRRRRLVGVLEVRGDTAARFGDQLTVGAVLQGRATTLRHASAIS